MSAPFSCNKVPIHSFTLSMSRSPSRTNPTEDTRLLQCAVRGLSSWPCAWLWSTVQCSSAHPSCPWPWPWPCPCSSLCSCPCSWCSSLCSCPCPWSCSALCSWPCPCSSLCSCPWSWPQCSSVQWSWPWSWPFFSSLGMKLGSISRTRSRSKDLRSSTQLTSMAARVHRLISANLLMVRKRASMSASSASEDTRSVLLSRMRSANATCCVASLTTSLASSAVLSLRWLCTCLASTRQMMPSR
mmetsp:Transcript_5194/g.17469  ORF Transcript_5194/g.17469 Transcript_5194/m.17469 type:complete len:242 (-) Transcript_5194:435-1160(-)